MTTLISGRWVTRSTKRSEMAGIPPRTARSAGSRFAPVGAGAPKGSKVSTSGCPEAAYSTTFCQVDCVATATCAAWWKAFRSRLPRGSDVARLQGGNGPAELSVDGHRNRAGGIQEATFSGLSRLPLHPAEHQCRERHHRQEGSEDPGAQMSPQLQGLALPRPSGRTHSTPVGAGRDNPYPRPVGALSASETPASRRARTSATAPGTPSPGALPPSGS